jgi:hypothetical protein
MLRFYDAAVAAVAASVFLCGPASASPITYTSQSSFLAAVGKSITDDYSNAGYVRSFGPSPPNFMTFSYMSSVLNETQYSGVAAPPNQNTVVGPLAGGGNPYYAAFGTNGYGSFDLGFTSTSLTKNGGVFGVSFNYRNTSPSNPIKFLTSFIVDFADGSSMSVSPPASGAFLPAGFATDYFGVTSKSPITDISFQSSNLLGTFGLDNLTIAAAPIGVPEPSALSLFCAGLAGMAFFNRRRRPRRAA